jgi:hypothetical protein
VKRDLRFAPYEAAARRSVLSALDALPATLPEVAPALADALAEAPE